MAVRYPSPFRIDAVKKVLLTEEVTLLDMAFTWENSNEGHRYWAEVYHKIKQFNHEHRRILEIYLKNFEEDNKKAPPPPPPKSKWDPETWGIG